MSSAIDSSIMAEHSTFIPSAGELASTVIIPIQVMPYKTKCGLSIADSEVF